MSGKVSIGGTEHPITSGRVCIGGSYRRITHGVASLDGEAWVTIANFVPPLSVSVTPSTALGATSPFKPIPQAVTTSALSALPSGGKSPFSYSWTIIDYDGATEPTLNSPSSASTTATLVVPANTDRFATARVTVTDALGTTATATGQFSFSNFSGPL